MIDYTATGNHTFPPLPLPVRHKNRAFVSEDRMQTLGEECDGRSCILPPTMNLKVRVMYTICIFSFTYLTHGPLHSVFTCIDSKYPRF